MTRHRQDWHRLPTSDFAPSEITLELSWVPDMASLGLPPLTAESYVEAYLADPGTWWWTTNDYSAAESTAVLKRVLILIKHAELPDDEKALGQLGAGPLENMMSDALLDRLRSWMPFTPAMCYALEQVRMELTPPSVQRRAAAMIVASQRVISQSLS